VVPPAITTGRVFIINNEQQARMNKMAYNKQGGGVSSPDWIRGSPRRLFMKKESDRTGTCSRAMVYSRQAVKALESINRDA